MNISYDPAGRIEETETTVSQIGSIKPLSIVLQRISLSFVLYERSKIHFENVTGFLYFLPTKFQHLYGQTTNKRRGIYAPVRIQ
jgi:hypothetical protein